MDDATIASTMKRIYTLRTQIEEIAVAREQAEKDLCAQYKVDECNGLRQTLIDEERAKIVPLTDELRDLQASLDDALKA